MIKIDGEKTKFLVIELDEMNGIPKVFYKGEEITNKIKIEFNWETQTEKPGKFKLLVRHGEKTDSDVFVNTISHVTFQEKKDEFSIAVINMNEIDTREVIRKISEEISRKNLLTSYR